MAPLARMICANPELSETDLRFNQAYFALLQQLDPAGRKLLQQEDQEFLNSVQRFCGVPASGPVSGSPDCVAAQYDHERAQWIARLSGGAYEEANRPIEQHIALQNKLQQLGFLPSTTKINGVYNAATRSAIVAWQNAAGRPATGLMSDADAAALDHPAAPDSLDSGSKALSPTSPPQRAAAPPAALQTPAPAPPVPHSGDNGFGVLPLLVLFGLLTLLWRRRRRKRSGGNRASRTTVQTPAAWKPAVATRERSQPTASRPHSIPPLEASISFGGRPRAERSRAKSPKVEGDRAWKPKGQSVTVAGHVIADGMIYVGGALSRPDGYGVDNCLIDPSLPVANRPATAGADQISYYPAYSRIGPEARRAYLLWLVNGKNDPAATIGFVFLYFYGLERRLILDRSTEEHDTLVAEVERLNRLYAGNASFVGYSRRLLDAARLIKPAGKFYEQSPPQAKTDFELPLSVRLAVGQLVSEGKPVPAEWMLAWLITDPNTYLRTPASRARTEFEELFQIRFAEKFPDGFRLNPPKRRLKHAYRAASASFTADLDQYVAGLPDISALTKPIEQMREIAYACTDALDPYSRFLGKQPEARGKFSAICLLPPELARRVEGDEIRQLRQDIDGSLANGPKLVQLRELLTRINGNPPAQIGKPALQACADGLAYFGIGVAPHPSAALQLPKADQPVVLYKLPEEEAGATDESVYRQALLFLGFAAYVAHADGTVSPAERQWLSTFVATVGGLGEAARAKLDANLRWLLAVPPELPPLRSRLMALPQSERHELGVVALSVACVGGGIEPAQIKALQRIYKALGLDEDKVLGDIHAFMSGADPAAEPVTIRIGGQSTQGYAIPKPPPPEAGVRLDPTRIRQISESTERVSEILGKVFAADEVDATAGAGASPGETPTPEQDGADGRDTFDGLDPRYRSFVSELLTRETWPREDLDLLARSFGIMTDGAIEAINEWAFDRYGDALLQDGEPLIVDAGLLPQATGATTTHA